MTGARKWEAYPEPDSDLWFVMDSQDGRNIADSLTESEARDIAGIDDIKAERDEAVRILKTLMENDGHMGKYDACVAYDAKVKAVEFLTSIKEQGDE